MRNILNQQKTNIYVNTLTAQLPLQIPSTSDTSSTINIGGLNSYGTAGQVLKVNSSADGLEYGSDNGSNWVADGTDLKVIDETSYNFIELKRSDTGDVGLKLNNSSYESKLYIDSDNTVLKLANSKLKFESSPSYINNSDDRLIIHSASGEIRVGNLTDFTSIFGTRTILNEAGRIIAYYDSSTNIIQLGNGVDTIKLSMGTLYQPKIDDASGNFTYNIVSGTLTASRNIILPVLTGNDTLVFEGQSQILTNKNITGTFTGTLTGNADTATNLASINATDIVVKTGSQTLSDKTLTSPIINNIKNSNSRNITNYSGIVLTIGNSSDLVEIFNSTLTGFKINDASADHQYIITSSELASNYNVILPTITATDTFCFTDVAQTLLNKTLTSPTITGTGNIAGTFTGNLTGNATTATNLATINATDIVVKTGSQTLTDKTLTSPIINNIKNSNSRNITNYSGIVLTIGNSTDLVEIFNSTLTGFKINDASADHQYIITSSELASNYNVILPTITATDTFCFTDVAQTLLNKTLTSPTITGTGNIAGSFTGNLTGNADTATKIASITNSNIVQLTGSQTLTDKTLTSPTILNIKNIYNRDIYSYNTTTGLLTVGGSTFDSVEIISNTLTLSGNVVASADTDTVSTFGRAKIGSMGYTDYAGFSHFDRATTTGYALLQFSNGDTFLNCETNTDIFFKSGNTTKMIMLGSTGNFGINTFTPSEKLEVVGNIKLSGTVVASSDTDTVSTFGRAKIGSMGFTDHAGFSHFDRATTTGYGILQSTAGDTYVNCETSQNIFFNCGNVDKMRMVGSTGNFGINTTTPSEKLEVVGNIKTSGILATALISNNITFSPVDTGNNFTPVLFLEGNVPLGSTIGGGAINNGGVFRSFCFGVESTSGSFRALGLFCNNTDSFSFTNGANYTFMGFFTPFSKTTAYSFTASHRCYSENNDLYNDDKIGLIVVSTGRYDSLYIDDIDVDNAIPIVEICSKKKSKCVLGVVGKYEKEGEDREGMNFGFVKVDEKDKNRLYINSIGEGAIWICNTNGNLENGDYIQSSSITGYGEKQDDDLLHNYSVAKITMDIDFNNIPNGFKTRTLDNDVIAVLCGCIYQQG